MGWHGGKKSQKTKEVEEGIAKHANEKAGEGQPPRFVER